MNPFDPTDANSGTGMTDDAEAAASEGWELMKVHKGVRLIYWKADDGWEGAWEVVAYRDPERPGIARIMADRWKSAQIIPDYNPN